MLNAQSIHPQSRYCRYILEKPIRRQQAINFHKIATKDISSWSDIRRSLV